MVDWKEHQKLIEDAQQYKLNPDLTITKNNYKYAKSQPHIDFDALVLCPFCLKSYRFDIFRVDKGLRICPNCNTKLKLSTLSKINNIDEFVKFVFNYRLNGFWSKICLEVKPVTSNTRFNEWNKRLHELRLSKYFWDEYKRLKGDNKNEIIQET